MIARTWARLATAANEWLAPVEHQLRTMTSAAHARAATTFGLRILARFGFARSLRVVGLVVWIGALLMVPRFWRPDLLHPADIGSDTSNYVAAAERLRSGHDLYQLVAGDRPAPLDNPPEWSVPILSPPAVATAYLPGTWLFDPIAYHLPWAIGLAAIAALGYFVISSGPLAFVPILMYISQNLAVTAWSGNVNAWIGPAAAFAWWACQRRWFGWPLLAGALVAVATAVKIGPGMLGVWLVARGRWMAVIGGVVTGTLVAAATVALAGPNVLGQYLVVVLETASAPTELSISGILHGFGLPPDLQSAGLLGTLLVAAALVVALRRSRLSYVVAVVAMAYATTVVRAESVAVAVAAIAVVWIKPFDARPTQAASPVFRGPISSGASQALGVGLIFAVVGVAASVAAGGLTRSSVAVTNQTTTPLVARFSLYAQSANFGYRIGPGQSAYGWVDRFGASPPVVTIWTADCQFVKLLELPRSGSHVTVSASGTLLDSVMPEPVQMAPYVPDCAADLIAALNGGDAR